MKSSSLIILLVALLAAFCSAQKKEEVVVAARPKAPVVVEEVPTRTLTSSKAAVATVPEILTVSAPRPIQTTLVAEPVVVTRENFVTETIFGTPEPRVDTEATQFVPVAAGSAIVPSVLALASLLFMALGA